MDGTARQLEFSGLLQFGQDVSDVKASFSIEEFSTEESKMADSLVQGLQLLVGAARFSFGHGYANACELYFQMCCRLAVESQDAEPVRNCMSKIGIVAGGLWLRPMEACLLLEDADDAVTGELSWWIWSAGVP